MATLEQLATTMQGLAGPGIKRKELVAAVREKHPKASKKDIVRAAFYALSADSDGSRPPIPTRSRPAFRFDVGHHSEMKPATR